MSVAGYVLVIDDSGTDGRHYERALVKAGFRVTLVGDVDTVAGWANHPPARPLVAVVDLVMPTGTTRYNRPEAESGERTGILVAQDLASWFPGLQIVMLTHSNNGRNLEAVAEMGATLLKKFDIPPYALTPIVKAIIERQR